MTATAFKQMALSFPGTVEKPHFDRMAFKVEGKRIFATLHEPSASGNIRLSAIDQAVFCSFDPRMVYRVPNKWGLQGWTTFELKDLPAALLLDALETAYKDALNAKPKKGGKQK